MDKSHQFYLFLFSTTTLFTDINPTGHFQHSWFDAQSNCKDQGLTLDKDKSDQPYWTGIYRRLTPWINILGCYDRNYIESLPYVIKKTMIISSVGLCQEICHRKIIDKFAVKMNECLCIDSSIHVNPFNRISPSECDNACMDKSDHIYPGDCGGKNAYNIYEIQEFQVKFDSGERCLSLQCSPDATYLSSKNCFESLGKVCENMQTPHNGNANSWKVSMEQCINSDPPYYLLGNVSLGDPHHICNITIRQLDVVWIGVVRQIYASIDQGWEIDAEEEDTFLKCQMCTNKTCYFTNCSDSSIGSIFCRSNTATSKIQTTAILTTSASMNGTLQKSSASDDIALKISLPVITLFIIVLLSALAVLFYKRRKNMTKTEGTIKAEVGSGPKKNIDSGVQNSSYFVLKQYSGNISKRTDSVNESPYNNSEEGVYDHLRDKKPRKPEVEDTYQHASAGVNRDRSEYDTMANALYKKQEEDDSYDCSHNDSNGNYACHIHAKNNLTDNPYDVAV